jgi:phage head maturation protease
MADPLADALKHYPLTLEKSAAPEFDARFVMSASCPDRVKDTIDPAAYVPHLRKRLIALWQHEREKPIGYWQNLKVDAGALVGEIKFASTALAQMVKTLIADGVPLGASIGFRAKGEPNDAGGLHFSELELRDLHRQRAGAPARGADRQAVRHHPARRTRAPGPAFNPNREDHHA